MSSKKADLIQAVLAASRELSTETVMFHTAIADRRGLSVTESKASDYLARLGPLTPKELARHSGLAPASVTALVDRLERKGIVRRKPHPDDRRKVLVELNQSPVSAALPLWDYIVSASVEICGKYSEDQLETILDFVTEAAAISHRAAERITQSP
ncbi:MAG: MarR family transcriptional regulator [Amycolatopsis sp.]|uniref:MarR family winged helix-turn-helix transcriptional regulator n=1 Tax=Amycolatopsis sp. TaxID=37632 RepID=UPI00260D3B0C|nr:MarR family transcriptional regulator [Amycolatopsis sp.]MCU1681712.1 MarR family transcriptional regulator [Amycolatopsis sp.]